MPNHNNPQISNHHYYKINTSHTQKFKQNFHTHRTTNNHQDPHPLPLPLPNPPSNHQPPLPIKHHDPRPIFKTQNDQETTTHASHDLRPKAHDPCELQPTRATLTCHHQTWPLIQLHHQNTTTETPPLNQQSPIRREGDQEGEKKNREIEREEWEMEKREIKREDTKMEK